MESKQELLSMFEGSVDSREKTLILFMCASESLPLLMTNDTTDVAIAPSQEEDQQAQEGQKQDDDEMESLSEIVQSVWFLTQKWIEKLQPKADLSEEEFLEMFIESKLLPMLVKIYFEGHSQRLPVIHSTIDQILTAIFENVNVAQENHVLFYLFLAVNANLFVNTQERQKFELCERIDRCVAKNLISCRAEAPVRNSVALITVGLVDILSSKLSLRFRNQALSLASTLTFGYGDLQWLEFQSESHPVNSKKAFLLLSTLVLIEIRLCLDRQQVENDLLGKCLVLFEGIFLRLVSSCDDDDDQLMKELNNSELISILERIKSTILTIVEFVCTNVGVGKQEEKSSLVEKTDSQQPQHQQEEHQVYPAETLLA